MFQRVRVRVGEERFFTEPFFETCEKSFSTEPFTSDVRKVCCETFATKPFLGIHDIGFLRNHPYGTFFTIFQKGFRRKPQFSRNQKRFRECIEVKNLFKFRRKPFFFRVKDFEIGVPRSSEKLSKFLKLESLSDFSF